MSWVNNVWRILDREQLANVVRRVPSVLFATVSGAHLYGFASADSDVDLRTNIDVLNGEFSFRQIDELVARKRAGAEKQVLHSDEVKAHNRELDRLENMLQSAYEESKLPEESTKMKELNDFIIRTRLHAITNSPAEMEFLRPELQRPCRTC